MKKGLLENETHMSMPPVAIMEGLKWLYHKPAILDVLLETLQETGLDKAIQQYQDLKETQPEKYDFGEQQLNHLGYALLNSKRIHEAIEIFKLNVGAYPEAANVYDSLGEAYAAIGEKALAIENYRWALELDPSMPSALHALEQLEAV
jgi:tetratricopeptide (TPR) repeat protein